MEGRWCVRLCGDPTCEVRPEEGATDEGADGCDEGADGGADGGGTPEGGWMDGVLRGGAPEVPRPPPG